MEWVFNREGTRSFKMAEQKQSVLGSGQAIQAQRDVHIGLTAEQMVEIISKVVQLHGQYTVDAEARVNARLEEIQADLVAKFATSKEANSEALKDPDFQYHLGEAQEAYARSGDHAVKDTLVDIITRRSQAESGSRLALALNDAATKAPRLTKNEFAVLSLKYLTNYTQYTGVNSVETFARYVNTQLVPFLGDISTEQTVFWHIESQNCGRLSALNTRVEVIWASQFAGVLGKGISLEQAKSVVAPERHTAVRGLLQPCIRDSQMLQPMALTKAGFLEAFQNGPLPETEIGKIWNEFAATIPKEPELLSMLEVDIPRIHDLFEVFDSQFKKLELNSVGIAIGHANASRVVGFNSPLSTWLQ